MSLSIADFRAQLPGQGSRPSLFYVRITNPIDPSADNLVEFRCKAAELPAERLNVTPVGYKGRKIKVAGESEYGDWQVTIINDEDFAIRDQLEAWKNAINGRVSNVMSDYGYASVGIVTQQDKQGNDIRSYRFHNIWPSMIESMRRDWDATNQIDQYGVTFTLDYFTVEGQTGSGGGE